MLLVSVISGLLPLCCAAAGNARAPVPVRLGVDDAGGYHREVLGQDPRETPAYFRALEDLGTAFISVHFWPVNNAGQDNSTMTRRRLEAIDRAMREHRIQYSLNVELSNWVPRFEITPGVNEFEHPGGIHRWDLRMEWLSAVLPPVRLAPPALVAVTYDECEHMILSDNRFANAPKSTFDRPFLVDTHGMDLTTSYDRLVKEATRIREEHYQNRIALQTEQVWPDLFHIFARAGWIITPKLLKENISSVVLAIAMGAAIQHQDHGTSFWASPDLWNWDRYPGHSPEALRSALLMAYWLGAETIYVENLDNHGWKKRHPEADPDGSLLRWADADHYELTKHGRVVRDFYKQYVPNHPRTVNWRHYRPRVVIIRLPDGGWGQFGPEARLGEPASRNRLLGNREMPLDEPASEWLHVWPVLTHGAARPGAISSGNPQVYPKGIEDFFAPIDSVAVFDHTVTASRLAEVGCIIVCGHALTPETFKAVADCAAAGATCVIARRLYAAHQTGDLPGNWLIVDDFKDPRIAATLAPFLGPPDVARFRFKDQIVEFRKGDKPDSINVQVLDRP